MTEIILISLGPVGRYFLFAGMTYLVFWKILAPRLSHRRTSTRALSDNQVSHEIRCSLVTTLIFACTGIGIYELSKLGLTRIYLDAELHGTAYLLASTIGLILFHDAYFYFTHRALHHPSLFRFHKTHHRSVNPSPWAAFSFHPVEAVINAMVVPIAVFVAPMHPIALGIFIVYTMMLNVMGHLGHEVFPRGFEKWGAFRIFNTATHHAMHHRLFNTHYSLYFNWWDRWLGTLHPGYADEFAQNTTRATMAKCGSSTVSSEKRFSMESTPRRASTGSVTRTAGSSM